MSTMLRWGVIVAVLTMAVPSVASAAEKFYVAVRGGPSWTSDNESGRAGAEDTDTFGLGLTASGGVGYLLPFGLRVEGEVGFVYSPLKTEGGVDVDGSIKSYLLMANLYYDLRMPALGPFKPYVGFGIGGARVNNDHEVVTPTLGRFEVDETRTAFAYQARVGVGYDVNKWLDVSAGYRFVHINGGNRTLNGVPINFGSINNHSVELGFSVKF